MSRVNWNYPNRRFSKTFITIICIRNTSSGPNFCFQTLSSTRSFADVYDNQHAGDELFLHNILWTDESCFTFERVFSVRNNNLWAQDNAHAAANLGIKSSSASMFGSYPRGHCRGPISAT
jgi:hypothetical protein